MMIKIVSYSLNKSHENDGNYDTIMIMTTSDMGGKDNHNDKDNYNVDDVRMIMMIMMMMTQQQQ